MRLSCFELCCYICNTYTLSKVKIFSTNKVCLYELFTALSRRSLAIPPKMYVRCYSAVLDQDNLHASTKAKILSSHRRELIGSADYIQKNIYTLRGIKLQHGKAAFNCVALMHEGVFIEDVHNPQVSR